MQDKTPIRAVESAVETDWDRHAYRVLSAVAILVLLIGTITFRLLEDWSWVDSFYFASIAVTTVGFGDLTPSTDASKLFTVAYVFSGIAVISLFINQTLRRHARRVASRHGS